MTFRKLLIISLVILFSCKIWQLLITQTCLTTISFITYQIWNQLALCNCISSSRIVCCFLKFPSTQKLLWIILFYSVMKKSKTPRGSLIDKCLNMPFFTELRAAITYRRDHVQMLFKTEIFGTSQCLSVNNKTLYHGTKSNILRRFEKADCPEVSPSSAIIIELSAILRCDFYAKTFVDFAYKIYNYIIDLWQEYDRIDVVCDRYFENSWKTQTGSDRGCGPVVMFDDESQFPSDFKDSFLKNNSNEEWINHFFANKLQIRLGDKSLTITEGNGIKTNNNALSSDPLISVCFAEEADKKLVRHMIQCVRSGVKKVVVRTVDTDVLMLLLGYLHFAANFDSNVYAWFGVGKGTCFYSINVISIQLGENMSSTSILPLYFWMWHCHHSLTKENGSCGTDGMSSIRPTP